MEKPKEKRVFVVGVGMTKFCKPRKAYDPNDPDFPDFAKTAVQRCLADACLSYTDVEVAVCGSAYGRSGQRCLYEVGMTGIPIHNVSNACATGSNALFLARSFVAGGLHECCLALGLEKMKPGPLGGDRKDPGANLLDRHMRHMNEKFPITAAPPNPQMFGNAGREHMQKYGTTARQFAMVGEKNHRHSVANPYSQFRDKYSLDDILASRMIYDPLTMLQCSPPSDGAAAAIVCSESFVIQHGLQGQAIEIVAQAMHTDPDGLFDDPKGERSCIDLVGFGMAAAAAKEVYKSSGLTPSDVQVIELHDCFSVNEVLTYEALGLCPEGQGGRLVEEGQTTYGGKWTVNPSGGLISKGHPLGATGLAQCAELNWQLRGEAGPRQVKNARVGLQHNLGLGGAVVVTMYRKPEAWATFPPKRPVSGGEGFPEARL